MSNITQKWVNILIPFSKNYNIKITGSKLSKLAKTPQQTVSRYLNKLVELNLLSYIKDGKNKSFYLDLTKEKTKIIFNIIENHKSLSFLLDNKNIAPLINEISSFCESLIVFGSYSSKSNKKNSDLDIVIVGESDKQSIKKIKKKQTIEINEHYISYADLKKSLNEKKPLAIEIMHNHTFFGDASKLVKLFLEAQK